MLVPSGRVAIGRRAAVFSPSASPKSCHCGRRLVMSCLRLPMLVSYKILVKMRAKARQNIHMKACESARERTRGSPGGTHKYASVTCPRGMSTWHSSSDHVDAYVARTRLGPRGRCAHMRRMNRLFWPHKLVHVACPRGQPIWTRGQPT